MSSYILWDVDTQYDFMMPDGRLYVSGAEKRIDNIRTLVDVAKRMSIPILGSVDYHDASDEELSEDPDFSTTFPPHCLKNTHGQEKIVKPEKPLWIDSIPYHSSDLNNKINKHQGEIYFRKQKFDVFSNPNLIPVLEQIKPRTIIVFGVALDVCVAHAIKGFLWLGNGKLILVRDAVAAIHEKAAENLLSEWKSRGVVIQSTVETVDLIQNG